VVIFSCRIIYLRVKRRPGRRPNKIKWDQPGWFTFRIYTHSQAIESLAHFKNSGLLATYLARVKAGRFIFEPWNVLWNPTVIRQKKNSWFDYWWCLDGLDGINLISLKGKIWSKSYFWQLFKCNTLIRSIQLLVLIGMFNLLPKIASNVDLTTTLNFLAV
jgi:hypothetical protein